MVTFAKPCNGFCVFICGGFDSKLRQSLFSSEIIFIPKLLPKFLKKRTNKFFESFDSQYFQKKLAHLGK